MARTVLHVIQSLEAGGAERVVVEYALAHDPERCSPVVCTIRGGGPLEDVLRSRGVPVHVLGRPGRMNPTPLVRLARLVRTHRPAVVHGHNFAGTSLAAAAAMVAGADGVVRTEHNVVVSNSRLRRTVSRLSSLREDAQIAVSDCVRRSHLADGRIGHRRFVTIWNGIDDSRLREARGEAALRAELGVADDGLLYLSVGSLTRQKNQSLLIEAAALMDDPRVVLAIAGKGPLRDELEKTIRARGLEHRVLLLGRRLDVPELLSAADAFVLSSVYEGLPITVLEAMAAGVPCIVSRVGGTPEVISDGESGVLVPPDDAEALAAAMQRLAGDDALRERLSAGARRVFERAFDAKHMVGRTEALYDLSCAGRADLATGDRLKVVFVIGQLGFGGTERQLVDLATRLDRDRFEPVVCSLTERGPMAQELDAAGVRVVALEKRPGVASGTLARLTSFLRAERPALLHTFLFSANWRGVVAGRVARVPVVVTSYRNVDIHGRRPLLFVERALSGMPDYVTANAKAVGRHVEKAHGIDADRIRVIYNGVDFERLRPRDAGHARRAGKTVVMIASLTPKKDPLAFVEVASSVADRCADVTFDVVGDGPLRGSMEELARSKGLGDRLRLLGQTKDVASVLAAADVSVLTSLKEGCSNVLLESMAVGVPVVVTDVGGNPELVEDGATGFVVPPGDPVALADRVVDILNDETLASSMGEAARRRARREFSTERMVERTTEFYRDAIGRSVPGLIEWVDTGAARRGAVQAKRGDDAGRR
ncbi:MAG: glycosyltransferase [Candidatus Eisenbacteria bacterium]|nr:glycosyltransferase [Candidatus Eisenbacteria bacterium]